MCAGAVPHSLGASPESQQPGQVLGKKRWKMPNPKHQLLFRPETGVNANYLKT